MKDRVVGKVNDGQVFLSNTTRKEARVSILISYEKTFNKTNEKRYCFM